MTEEEKNMVLERRKSAKHARKRAEGLWWAGALIWAGLVFGADSLDLLPQAGDADAWSWVFLGAWDWIWSGGLTLVGLGGFTTISISWPLILILIGAAILVSQYVQRH
jgi:hypothetical protein